MKYAVIGAGGTGGPIGGFLARAGKDVTMIARGRHLFAMQKDGLKFEGAAGSFTVPVKACTMEDYADIPDVIFVCVKGYSLADTIPFLRKTAGPHTVVVPILNIYGTGKRLQKELPGIPVTDGCIYIAAEIKEPGTILMSGTIFRVVYGLRRETPEEEKTRLDLVLKAVERDLKEAGILPVYSSQIERDALQKFSFVSPMAAVGACYDVTASKMQEDGAMRDLFTALVREIRILSEAMGAAIPEDIVTVNLNIMDDLAPSATASMQRDIRDGRPSEIDGLVYEVVRMGQEYGVELPAYREIAGQLRDRMAGK